MANLFNAYNAPEGEPKTIVIGDFVRWKRSDFIKDYSSGTHTVKFIARQHTGAGNEISVTATVLQGSYLFTIESSDSVDFIAGDYHWQIEVTQTSTSSRITVDRGYIKVLSDLDENEVDPRSHAQIMLTKIESLLSGKADSDVASYSIAGRSLNKMTFEELVNARDFYRREVLSENNKIDVKHGRKGSSTIQVRF